MLKGWRSKGRGFAAVEQSKAAVSWLVFTRALRSHALRNASEQALLADRSYLV